MSVILVGLPQILIHTCQCIKIFSLNFGLATPVVRGNFLENVSPVLLKIALVNPVSSDILRLVVLKVRLKEDIP